MPKAILEFNLPEEQCEFNLSSSGNQWALTCWDINEKLRSYLKYDNDFKTPDEALGNIRDFLYETMIDRNINFNMID